LPVCFAKTPYSFSADPKALGAPSGHSIPVSGLRLMAGAGFVVALSGDIRTMPGLPRHPAALNIKLVDGLIEGLS
jgi:formate--tetrahydrofolate ligase